MADTSGPRGLEPPRDERQPARKRVRSEARVPDKEATERMAVEKGAGSAAPTEPALVEEGAGLAAPPRIKDAVQGAGKAAPTKIAEWLAWLHEVKGGVEAELTKQLGGWKELVRQAPKEEEYLVAAVLLAAESLGLRAYMEGQKDPWAAERRAFVAEQQRLTERLHERQAENEQFAAEQQRLTEQLHELQEENEQLRQQQAGPEGPAALKERQVQKKQLARTDRRRKKRLRDRAAAHGVDWSTVREAPAEK